MWKVRKMARTDGRLGFWNRVVNASLIFLFVSLIFMPAGAAILAEAEDAGAATAGDTSPASAELDLSGYFPAWAQAAVLGVAVWRFVTSFVFILIGLVLRKISDYVFSRRIIPLLKKTPFEFDNLFAAAVSKPLGYLFLLGGLSAAFAVLPLPAEARGFVYGGLRVLLAADVVWFLFRVVDVAVYHMAKLAGRTESQLDDQLVPLMRKALKVTIGVICFVWVVQLLGYSVSSLLAGLGIGGLAVALALQDTLSNFFGSIFIFLDRPFAVGDWIKVNDVEGIVEEVGFRSTRVRTWPATLVSVPNKTMANATIDNWSKMPKRRVLQTVGVTYETSAEQMEQAVAAIREMVTSDPDVDKEFIVVRFTEFGASSLDIMVLYFTKSTTLAEHAATKERINLAVMRKVDEIGLSIAFPTQTVYFEGEIAKAMAGRAGKSERS